MQTLLHIRTSLFSQDGESSRLADQYLTRWQAAHPAEPRSQALQRARESVAALPLTANINANGATV